MTGPHAGVMTDLHAEHRKHARRAERLFRLAEIGLWAQLVLVLLPLLVVAGIVAVVVGLFLFT